MARGAGSRAGASKEIDFQSLFEAAPGSFLVLEPVSPDFTIVAVSEAYLRATLTRKDDIIGKKLFDTFPDNPEDTEATGMSNLRASLEHVIESLKPNAMAVQKYDIPKPGGGFEERYWSPLNTPVLGKDGKIAYIIHRVEDVTDFVRLKKHGARQNKLAAELRDQADKMEAEIYRRAQEIQVINKELLAANEKLSRLDSLKTQFFTNVSHEFRTPLTLMLGLLESSLDDTKRALPESHQKNIELAYQNALRLERLVNSLLDFSRLEAGKNVAAYRPTALSQLTLELSSIFESAAKKAGLAYEVDCQPLGAPVYVDVEFWEKIVLNLLSNAFKHTFEGRIVVRLRRVGDNAVLEVEDTGTGIPKKELPHLFERFYQVKGAESRSHEGSGIGLALVHDLVGLHGGTISVKSVQGKGSIFTVRIPFGKDHLPKKQIARNVDLDQFTGDMRRSFAREVAQWVLEEYEEEEVRPKSTATILVVDDNSDMRYYIKSVLSKNRAWQVQLAGDGVAALRRAQETRPDIILSDIMMPRMDGRRLVSKLRANPATKNIPIIFLSARAGEEAKIEGLARGVDDYLVKPFTAKELVARVDAHLKLAIKRKKAHAEELEQLWELNKAKDDFISLASHQLRTPVTGVKQYVGMLLEGYAGKLTHHQLDMLRRAYEANERGLGIIEDLLKVAKVDAGKLTVHRKPTDLAKLIREVVAEQSEKIKQRSQTISFTPPAASPPALVDATLIRMVVENLVDNASKYSGDGEDISLGLDYDKTEVKISVQDHGIGIDKDELPKLFQKFSRLSNSRSIKTTGTGIGLYWAKKVLDVHGGDISVTSKIGSGSSFVVTLPQD